jgi:hypothetical protein
MMVVLTAMCLWSQSRVTTWEDAYHTAAPRAGQKLPPILSDAALWGEYGGPTQKRAYTAARANSTTIYQLPCKCHCERQGHTSLRSCFESLHGAGCYVCIKEVLYADQQARRGKTPAQIRNAINRSEHNAIQLGDQL